MIDDKDEIILDVLKKQADLSTYQIAKKTGIPQTTILNRIKKLKQSGVIKKFTVELDHKVLDRKVAALIFSKVNKHIEKSITGKIGSVEEKLLKNPEVISVKRLLGRHDFVIEVIVKDVDALNAFLIDKIRNLDYLSETETVVVLEQWSK
jgi:Lrp/AsnC family transcriptional regulator, regulator for asnA, asnC and gidA